MKKFKYISIFLSLLLATIACSDGFDKTYYDPNLAKPGELLALSESEYLLTVEHAEEIVETFKWGAIEFNYQAAVQYTLEVDLAGNDFKNAQEVTAVNTTEASVSVSVLNRGILELQKVYKFQHETPQALEFRVKGSISASAQPIYTNVVEATVTSYFEYNKVWVIGDYSGWDHGESLFLYEYDDSKPHVFEAWIDFADKAKNGFKLTGAASWDKETGNWGIKEGHQAAAEAESIPLMNDGSDNNIEAYSNRFYKFSFNNETLILTKLASMNSFGITGTALVGGSDFAMDYDMKNQEFIATVTVQDGGIKFRADGQDGTLSLGKGSGEGNLAAGGGAIDVKAGTYKITVNINNALDYRYAIEEGEPLDPSKITAPILDAIQDNIGVATSGTATFSWQALDFGEQESANVNYTLQMDLAGANFANAKVIGESRETSISAKGEKLLSLLKELDATADIDKPFNIELRVVAAVSSLPNPFISNVETTTITIKALPTTLYMIGDAIGTWNWASPAIVDMIPVNGHHGKFWVIKYLEAGKGFKWSPVKGWGDDFSGKNNNVGFTQNDGNAMVSKTGLYMIFVDLESESITVETPQVFGMGDVFGNWDMGANPLAIVDKNMTATASATAADSELRLYANSTIANIGSDWWRMEFILRNGVIEYRGNGGDQERVKVTAGQKITLDFTANTGTIE